MDRQRTLERKRENSKRLRSDPAYRAREAEYSKKYIKDPDVKKRKVEIQVNYERRLNFGISYDYYLRMKEDQDHKCAICGTTEPGGRGDFHVDHNHETGEVRQLLCCKCNLGLGYFNDNVDLLLDAVEYLRSHKKLILGDNGND